MASLVALKFETADGAQQALTLTKTLRKQKLIDITDGATVTWHRGQSRPKTHHIGQEWIGALDGTFWGLVLGLFFFVPAAGLALGAVTGVIAGHFTSLGITEDFIAKVRQKVTEGTSALFLLVGKADVDRVASAFKSLPPFEIIATNLSPQQEEKLRAEFEAAA